MNNLVSLQRARELRRSMTRAELTLWFALRDRRLLGYKFSRQVPIGPFVDFCCRSRTLIVEVDGGQHADDAEYDEKRTRWLRAHGYRVIRVWNNDVLQNLPGVLEHIRRELEQPPSPACGDLSRKRER